jgi:hypothetical protein
MMRSWRIGLYLGLAILGDRTVADAQPQPTSGVAARPRATAIRAGIPAPASRPGTSASVASAMSGATSGMPPVTPAMPPARRSTASSFNRLTSTSRRGAASSAPRETPAGIDSRNHAEGDPFRAYSAQARQSAAAISPTRLSEAPPPPQVAPPARYDYYRNIRSGQHLNANLAQTRRHCTPSRGGVMAGSLGGGR